MDVSKKLPQVSGTAPVCSRGFTLIELLTVIAIISLLISILVPSLSKARDGAKNTKTRAIMKSCGDGLEQFVTENDDELRGKSYPASKAADDPTDIADNTAPNSPTVDMFGAQWLVRYLMGKKLDGYVARKSVPPAFFDPAPPAGFAQKGWYDNPGDTDWPTDGPTDALTRSGPYFDAAAAKLMAPKDIVGYNSATNGTGPRVENPVFVDTFGMPILYYAADSAQASKANANIASYAGLDPADPNTGGIYTFKDNAIFTGLCVEGSCSTDFPRWDFGQGEHKLNYGPAADWVTAPTFRTDIGTKPNSFPYHVLNKQAYESTGKKAVVPSRRDSFLLWSPGKDGLFGTDDDVTNF